MEYSEDAGEIPDELKSNRLIFSEETLPQGYMVLTGSYTIYVQAFKKKGQSLEPAGQSFVVIKM